MIGGIGGTYESGRHSRPNVSSKIRIPEPLWFTKIAPVSAFDACSAAPRFAIITAIAMIQWKSIAPVEAARPLLCLDRSGLMKF
jgi:hypothetical protein